MKKILFLSLTLLAVFAMQASYADDSYYNPDDSYVSQPMEGTSYNQHIGPYAELTAGPNLYLLGVYTSLGRVDNTGFVGYGWTGSVGYNFNPTFALEVGFMQNYINELDVTHRNSGHTNIGYLTSRFNIPMGERFSFIGKLGLMYASVKHVVQESDTESLVLPYTGIGIGYAATQNLDVSLQYQGFIFGIINGGVLGLGLTYHFS